MVLEYVVYSLCVVGVFVWCLCVVLDVLKYWYRKCEGVCVYVCVCD